MASKSSTGNPEQIILASASPRRRILLRQIGLTFEVLPAGNDESLPAGTGPVETVESLARTKAETVVARRAPGSSLVIGADTIVVLDEEILGKPADPEEARTMLHRLSGRTHQVYTGVALIRTGSTGITDRYIFHERTDVTFGKLTGEEIAAYVNTGSPLDKAGAYGIQDDLGALFVRKINGDYYNVVGFPLHRFYREVNKRMPGIVTPFEQGDSGL